MSKSAAFAYTRETAYPEQEKRDNTNILSLVSLKEKVNQCMVVRSCTIVEYLIGRTSVHEIFKREGVAISERWDNYYGRRGQVCHGRRIVEWHAWGERNEIPERIAALRERDVEDILCHSGRRNLTRRSENMTRKSRVRHSNNRKLSHLIFTSPSAKISSETSSPTEGEERKNPNIKKKVHPIPSLGASRSYANFQSHCYNAHGSSHTIWLKTQNAIPWLPYSHSCPSSLYR